jgi:hypothetical protein
LTPFSEKITIKFKVYAVQRTDAACIFVGMTEEANAAHNVTGVAEETKQS